MLESRETSGYPEHAGVKGNERIPGTRWSQGKRADTQDTLESRETSGYPEHARVKGNDRVPRIRWSTGKRPNTQNTLESRETTGYPEYAGVKGNDRIQWRAVSTGVFGMAEVVFQEDFQTLPAHVGPEKAKDTTPSTAWRRKAYKEA